jgi:hypothetical protein
MSNTLTLIGLHYKLPYITMVEMTTNFAAKNWEVQTDLSLSSKQLFRY